MEDYTTRVCEIRFDCMVTKCVMMGYKKYEGMWGMKAIQNTSMVKANQTITVRRC